MIKDEVLKFSQWNYAKFIELYNTYPWWDIVDVVIDWQNCMLLWRDWTTRTSNTQVMQKTFITMLLMQWIVPWDVVKEIKSNSATLNFRKIFTPSVPVYQMFRWWLTSFIVHSFSKMTNWTIRMKFLYARGYSTYYMQDVIFTKTANLNTYVNADPLKNIMWEWDQREQIKEALKSAMELPIVKNFKITQWRVNFTMLPYSLDLQNWFSITMPEFDAYFDIRDKKFMLNTAWYMHPHIWSYVCMWTFQTIINQSWYKFDIALLNFHELACTYNKWSPFHSPFFYEESRRFLVRNWCKICYQWMCYTIEEFDVWLKARYENYLEFYRTIFWESPSVDERKRRYWII